MHLLDAEQRSEPLPGGVFYPNQVLFTGAVDIVQILVDLEGRVGRIRGSLGTKRCCLVCSGEAVDGF